MYKVIRKAISKKLAEFCYDYFRLKGELMKLVGLVGPAGCGKSTVADILYGFGYKRLKFSQPLKDMLKALGCTDEHTEGKLKEKPCDLLSGRTPRFAMQTLGTEWARGIMDVNFWLNIWKMNAQKYDRIVAEDCRFENESKIIKSLGGVIWKINRPGFKCEGHASETEMELIQSDTVINNHGGEADLKMMVMGLVGTDAVARSQPWDGDDIGENMPLQSEKELNKVHDSFMKMKKQYDGKLCT